VVQEGSRIKLACWLSKSTDECFRRHQEKLVGRTNREPIELQFDPIAHNASNVRR